MHKKARIWESQTLNLQDWEQEIAERILCALQMSRCEHFNNHHLDFFHFHLHIL